MTAHADKTSFIRALSGVDCDRLKEEKERGITIELGFASLDLPGGRRLGIVDVPGHEKFVRNMVAGAAGMDLVAFVVAADEGIMPQTMEHFQQAKEKDLPYTVDRGTAKVDVAPWPFLPEDGQSAPEFRFDPHVWTSPKNAIVQVTNIGAALEKAAPSGAQTIKSHVDAYTARLNDLDQWAHDTLTSVPPERHVARFSNTDLSA